jgi:hypothetical protein
MPYYFAYGSNLARSKYSIHASDGIISDVWVYAVVEKEKFIPPTKEYLGIMKDASVRLRFPKEYALDLEKVETK